MEFQLRPYNRGVTNDDLLADLQSVARVLAKPSPTQAEYDAKGRFSAAALKKRFGTWNKALTAAGLRPAKLMSVDQSLLIGDIQRVAATLRKTKLTRSEYDKLGIYSSSPIERRFGTWKQALEAAKLKPGCPRGITNEELFDNLERVWRHLGRQPTISEMIAPLSAYSGATYAARFGGYRKALEAFVSAVNQNEPPTIPHEACLASERPEDSLRLKRATARTVNYRLRFLTLRRDAFRCRACGRSPAKDPDVELEVDHVVPWSRGGETVLDNLQTLCAKCNAGKSNLLSS